MQISFCSSFRWIKLTSGWQKPFTKVKTLFVKFIKLSFCWEASQFYAIVAIASEQMLVENWLNTVSDENYQIKVVIMQVNAGFNLACWLSRAACSKSFDQTCMKVILIMSLSQIRCCSALYSNRGTQLSTSSGALKVKLRMTYAVVNLSFGIQTVDSSVN